jgi:hypothetical protein
MCSSPGQILTFGPHKSEAAEIIFLSGFVLVDRYFVNYAVIGQGSKIAVPG